MDTHEEKRAEAQLHDSDYEFGEPLDIGEGYSVAFHSATCRYCKAQQNKPSESSEVLVSIDKSHFREY